MVYRLGTMAGHVAPYALVAVALVAAAGSTEECAEQTDVVVKAQRFGDGRSYAYLVENNGTAPIHVVTIGQGAFISVDYSTEPASTGSPRGWKGEHVVVPDPRRPASHSATLIKYRWKAEDPAACIQPGLSLSGFSIQLPTPHESALAYLRRDGVTRSPADLPWDPPFEERLAPQPDLTDVPFSVLRQGGCEVEGTVELDGLPAAREFAPPPTGPAVTHDTRCLGPATDVVVKALRFSDGHSYAYSVTNNGRTPIRSIYIGRGAFIDNSNSTVPASIGSPRGWSGQDVWMPDPRRPGWHAPRLIEYQWRAGDDRENWIQPGRSLSGFSIQLPTPHESALIHLRRTRAYSPHAELRTDPAFAEQLPLQPYLADVPFSVLPWGGCLVVGTVELDGDS